MSQAVPGLSVGFQAGSAMFDAVAQANNYRSAAGMDMANAHQAELEGAINIDDIRRRGRATQGEAIAALAEGGSIGGGSASDLIFQNSLEIEYAAMNAHYAAATEARGYRFRAKQERTAATAAIVGGVMRAGAAAVSGIQQQRDQARQDAAYQQRYEAYFPGGQRLPTPAPPPMFQPQYRPGP